MKFRLNLIACLACCIAICGIAIDTAAQDRAERPSSVYLSFNTAGQFEGEQLVAGVSGNAMVFPAKRIMALNLAQLSEMETLDEIAISAWLRPNSFERYNEIFRQEGDHRILFSLQENATILSLGLDINGYIECDAPIDREMLFDGDWHFAAAVFDGEDMRVYLDGKEIHRLHRPGKISFDSKTLGFVGSMQHRSELFRGEIDELAISTRALTAETIATTYRNGMAALAEQYEAVAQELAEFYDPKEDFATTLVTARTNFRQYVREKNEPASVLKAGLTQKLKSDFGDRVREFGETTGMSPADYIMRDDLSPLREKTAQTVQQMIEYMPLTENQWRLTSDKDRQKWEAVQSLQKQYGQIESFDTPESLAALFAILESARNTIEDRPVVSEAVAPYIVPNTPEPRAVDTENAEEMLKADWLHQCDNNPTPQRVWQEIEWAVKLATRLQHDAALQQLAKLQTETRDLIRRNKNLSDESRELYFRVRSLKREIQLANPVIDFSQILLVDMPYPAGSEWQHETRHRLGYMAIPGGQLLVLDGLSPDAKTRRLLPQEPLHGSLWRPDLSHDATRVLVSFKPHNEKSFHIYEINLDGTGFRQITGGMFDDLDPVYLPDGKNFVFSTTRGYTYVRCMPPTNAFVLARCALDGKDVYLISQNNEPDYLPSVLNDGRVIYTRWEYTDKPLWRCQSLWTGHPDGTQHNTFWGNQSVWPDLLKDARSIPGSRRVMFTGSAHHNWFAGSIGIVNPDEGVNFPHGLTKVTADVEWPETGNGPVDPVESPDYHAAGKYHAYCTPYPLSENDFLVSANQNGKFVLYLMDVDGNRELIYEGVNNIFHAIPIRKQAVPPVIADHVDWPTRETRDNPKSGTIYSGNVYFGAPDELKGKAKFLRVLHIEQKTYTLWNSRPYISTGPVVSMIQSEGVKRVLGTVPIEADGSVWFEAPAGVALHFQLLDENHRALQTMRSFTGLMPGENRGCLGCHEQHSKAPEQTGQLATALSISPKQITPVPWAFDQQDFAEKSPRGQHEMIRRFGTSISYLKDVKPVLQQYCAECHQGDGEGRATFDMTPRPGFLMFEEPYVTIIGVPNWGAPGNFPTHAWAGGRVHDKSTFPPGFDIAGTLHVEAFDTRDPQAYTTTEPMQSLSYKSRLIHLASSGEHYDVKVDPISELKLILWVDAICPYIDESHICENPDPVFQGVNWLSVPPRLKTAPVVVRPGPFDAIDNDPVYQSNEK